VHFLTTAIQIITILPQLLAQHRIHIGQLLDCIFHNDVFSISNELTNTVIVSVEIFIVFARRRGDFAEMMDVRGVIGELGLTPALSERRGRKISSVINSLNIWHPSLSPFGESRSEALKARSAHRFDWCFFCFLQSVNKP
jgi:hypothetical protein